MREQPASYLAVVTDHQQVRVHCPLCLLRALGKSLIGAMVAKDASLGAVARMATALHEVNISCDFMIETEIDAAMRLLTAAIVAGEGEHTDDIPF
jgi:hypothetical protein